MPPKKDKKAESEEEKLTRIAIVSSDKCKPKKCGQECKRSCPVVRMGKLCIEVMPTDKVAFISEDLCIGCNICVKKCPFEAISIINLPKDLEKDTTHRYGPNSHKLHRLPTPRPGQVLGLVGTNGIGKSTALKILSGKLKPNLGKHSSPPEWSDILSYFRGSELQGYFTKILEDNLKAVLKPQYVDQIPRAVKGKVVQILTDMSLKTIKERATKFTKDRLGKISKKDAGLKPQVDEFAAEFKAFVEALGPKVTAVHAAGIHEEESEALRKTVVEFVGKLRALAPEDSAAGFELADAVEALVAFSHDISSVVNKAAGYITDLDLRDVLGRQVEDLSGGELQRFAIATACVQDADVYMFDEPSSYLDVKQRLKAAQVIRSLIAPTKYIIVVEHDLSVLDYLSDFVCCLYGQPGTYGVVTTPFGVREGINVFLAGFVPTENLRFRDTELTFKVSETVEIEAVEKHRAYKYPGMTKTLEGFKLNVNTGEFTDSEIIVLLGENGTGKTTFIRMLAGLLPPDEGTTIPELNISYKPQKISPKFEGTVKMLLYKRIRDAMIHPQFITDVFKPMNIEPLLDQEVTNLSGGELQRVAIVLCLGQPADIYLIDEPSAYLDSEQRLIAARVIKRFILHAKKTAFIVEHDFIMATYLADRVIVYEGRPGVDCTANAPEGLLTGMNKFLKQLDVTFRRDPTNHRPRINKHDSVKDKEQKSSGNFFVPDADRD